MPKIKKSLTVQLYDLAHQFANKVVEATLSVSPSRLPADNANRIHEKVDSIIIKEYGPLIEEVREMEEFNFNRAVIAGRYGVDPSEVTDDFLNIKMQEAHDEAEKALAEHVKQLGIELQEDTQEYREKISKEVDMIIKRAPN